MSSLDDDSLELRVSQNRTLTRSERPRDAFDREVANALTRPRSSTPTTFDPELPLLSSLSGSTIWYSITSLFDRRGLHATPVSYVRLLVERCCYQLVRRPISRFPCFQSF